MTVVKTLSHRGDVGVTVDFVYCGWFLFSFYAGVVTTCDMTVCGNLPHETEKVEKKELTTVRLYKMNS